MTDTKKVEQSGTEQEGDYFVLPGESSRYSRGQIMAMTIKCKEGEIKRFVADKNSPDFKDLQTNKFVFVRNDIIQPEPVPELKKPPVVSRGGAAMARAMAIRRWHKFI